MDAAMPSSSRPYQSRLLKFVLRQYQQGLERHRRAVRQAKTTATWGAQTALYPIYVLFQTSRLLGQQLAEQRLPLRSTQSSQIQSSAGGSSPLAIAQTSPAEVPLLTALADVRQWLQTEQAALLVETNVSPEGGIIRTNTADLQTAARLLAQGIASDIVTQKLVLVDRWNAIWDILSAEQADRLRAQIAWLLVNFELDHQRYLGRRRWRLSPVTSTKRSLPGIGRFLRLMGWIQTSPIARAANLFAEAALVELPPVPPELRLTAHPRASPPSSLNDNHQPKTPVPAEVALQVQPPAAVAAGQTSAGIGQQTLNSPPTKAEAAASESPVVAVSDYVETTAMTTGYLEHPLERLLRWIDQALSWIEQQSDRLRDWWRTRVAR